ncbi:hypothetical protein [Halorussus marinus]|uniref:hypothetical protein n=1 Tax=Halorussus marinus TaxID=2505976 RepID=UPI001431A7C8|nr:hypothetical protein [Halorussus marinus]
MEDSDARDEAIDHLRDALDADDAEPKDFHVRQALQLLDVDEESSDAGEDGSSADRA